MSSPFRRIRIDCAGMYRPVLRDGLQRRSAGDGFAAIGACQKWLREHPVFPALPTVERLLPFFATPRDTVHLIGAPGRLRAARALPAALGLDGGLRVVDTPQAFRAGEGTWVAMLGPAWVVDAVDALVAVGARVIVVGPGEEDEDVSPPPGGAWVSDRTGSDGRLGVLGAGAWLVAGLCGVDLEALHAATEAALRGAATPDVAGHPSWPWALAIAGATQQLGREDQVHLYDAPQIAPLVAWAAGVWGSMLASSVAGPEFRRRLGGRSFAAPIGDEEVAEMLFAGNTGASVVLWESPAAGALPIEATRLVEGTLRRAHTEGVPLVRVRTSGLDLATIASLQVLTLHAAIGAALLLDRDPTAFVGAPGLMPPAEVDGAEGAE